MTSKQISMNFIITNVAINHGLNYNQKMNLPSILDMDHVNIGNKAVYLDRYFFVSQLKILCLIL